ncbi:MAG: type II secretion system F family protein [Victivallaceae bacterium]|nr:type II secretion system F family protein [Victivallaceae bacterium]
MLMTVIASLAAGMSVLLATFVIVDFIRETSARYRENYIKEAAVELDDVLLQMPPGRILDVSLAISGFCFFVVVGIYAVSGSEWSWTTSLVLGAIAAVSSFPAPRLYLKLLHKHRMIKFNEQLEDALSSMSSSIKAGFSINQAMETVAEENKRPISFEFSLLVQELRLGVPLEKALDNMVNRLDSPDLELVATALITARQTGGELTQILDRLAGVIRERMRIANKLRAMTAQGRLQAIIIGIMPFALMFAMAHVAPDTMKVFFDSAIGIISIIVVIILDIVGFLVIKKITTIDV